MQQGSNKNKNYSTNTKDLLSLASEYSTNFDEFSVIIQKQQDTISKLVIQNDKLIDQNEKLLNELLRYKSN